MNKALIVVDCQKDFCEGGSLAVPGGNAVCINIARDLLGDYAYPAEPRTPSPYELVILTKDWHLADDDNGGHISDDPDFVDSWPAHCIAMSDGSKFHDDIAAKWRTSPHKTFYKGMGSPGYSGFEAWYACNPLKFGSDVYLDDYLKSRHIDEIDVCGIAAEYCVRATALDGVKHGYKVKVLGSDYVAGFGDIKAVQDEVLAAQV